LTSQDYDAQSTLDVSFKCGDSQAETQEFDLQNEVQEISFEASRFFFGINISL